MKRYKTEFFRKMTKKVTIDGKEYLNLSTTNYLSFVGDKRIEVGISPVF